MPRNVTTVNGVAEVAMPSALATVIGPVVARRGTRTVTELPSGAVFAAPTVTAAARLPNSTAAPAQKPPPVIVTASPRASACGARPVPGVTDVMRPATRVTVRAALDCGDDPLVALTVTVVVLRDPVPAKRTVSGTVVERLPSPGSGRLVAPRVAV